jgi:hypothetical protein
LGSYTVIRATRQQTMVPKIIGIGRYEKGAEYIDETIITIAAIRTLRAGCKPQSYFYLWTTRQQTMEPKKNRIGRGKIYGVDISRTIRTVAAIRILRRMSSLDTPWRAGMARRLIRKNIYSKQTLISTLTGHRPLVLRAYMMALQQCDWSTEI